MWGVGERKEGEESVTIQTQNVTELAKNGGFLIEDEVDIHFMQECKVREEEQAKIQNASHLQCIVIFLLSMMPRAAWQMIQ